MTAVAPERLRDGRDIAAVLRGRRRAGDLVALHVGSSPSTGPARLAVVASRRVGGAVRRNRAKRLLREASRRLHWADGHDVVLVARSACAESTLQAVTDEVGELGRQLGVAVDHR